VPIIKSKSHGLSENALWAWTAAVSPADVSDAGEPGPLNLFSGNRSAKFPKKLAESEKRSVKAGIDPDEK
jgi:hypothetical protein